MSALSSNPIFKAYQKQREEAPCTTTEDGLFDAQGRQVADEDLDQQFKLIPSNRPDALPVTASSGVEDAKVPNGVKNSTHVASDDSDEFPDLDAVVEAAPDGGLELRGSNELMDGAMLSVSSSTHNEEDDDGPMSLEISMRSPSFTSREENDADKADKAGDPPVEQATDVTPASTHPPPHEETGSVPTDAVPINLSPVADTEAAPVETPAAASLPTLEPALTEHFSPKENREMFMPAPQADDLDVMWDQVNERRDAARLSDAAAGAAIVRPIGFWEALHSLQSSVGKKKSTTARSQPPPPPPPPSAPPRQSKSSFLCSCCSEHEVVSKSPNGVSASRTPSRSLAVEDDLEFIRALQNMGFEHHDLVHRRILLTIFHALLDPEEMSRWRSDASRGLPCDGLQWDLVGFQGADPATDLRSTGMFGLLQLLYMIDVDPSLTRALWAACYPSSTRTMENELPYVLVGINLTAMVIDALRQELLLSTLAEQYAGLTANREKSSASAWVDPSYPAVSACCRCFVGAVRIFMEAWEATCGVSTKTHAVARFGDLKSKLRQDIISAKGIRRALHLAETSQSPP